MRVPGARILPAAVADIDEQADYYQLRDVALKDRFLDELASTIGALARAPGLGSPRRLESVPALRVFPVSAFGTMLVFYREEPQGIEVVRVLHARRNWLGLLEEES